MAHPFVKVKYTGPLHVIITREPFMDWVTLHLPNGHTEELEAEETREWFRLRGANMDALEKALDQVFNFNRAEVLIKNAIEPAITKLPHSPNI